MRNNKMTYAIIGGIVGASLVSLMADKRKSEIQTEMIPPHLRETEERFDKLCHEFMADK